MLPDPFQLCLDCIYDSCALYVDCCRIESSPSEDRKLLWTRIRVPSMNDCIQGQVKNDALFNCYAEYHAERHKTTTLAQAPDSSCVVPCM